LNIALGWQKIEVGEERMKRKERVGDREGQDGKDLNGYG